jgi:hypothetical protein
LENNLTILKLQGSLDFDVFEKGFIFCGISTALQIFLQKLFSQSKNSCFASFS